jgi:hypothetical protein
LENKLTFSVVPSTGNSLSYLGSLVFDKRQLLGKSAHLDFRANKDYPELLRDCLAALNEHVAPHRISSALTVNSYQTAISELIRFCKSQGASSNFRMKDLTFEFLLDYRAYLRITYAHLKSTVRRRRFGNLLRLIEAGTALGIAPSNFSAPRNFKSANDNDRTQPYTAGEAIDLEDACRTHVRTIIQRLDHGKDLLRNGMDPRGRKNERDVKTGRLKKIDVSQRSWNQLPNVLWYVVNVMNGRYLDAANLKAERHWSFSNAVGGVWGAKFRKSDVYSYLYPSSDDLIPFILLIAKRTGRNESSILNLTRDCIKMIGGRTFLCYEKARGAAKLYKKAVDDDGPYSTAQLIQNLLKITRPLVQFADPTQQHFLFLSLTMQSRTTHVKCLDPAYIKYQMNRDGGWCDQWTLVNRNNLPFRISLRRLRVTYLTERYKRTGQLSNVSRDAAHSFGNTINGYVNNDATKHLHEIAIEAGIQAARSVSKPTVLTVELEAAAASVLHVEESIAQSILHGNQDVFFSSCRDFYNRPGGAKNTPCDRPWGCFQCSNAIITRNVLPRVLEFKKFLLAQKTELEAAEWEKKFEQVWQILTQDVLPKFSAQTIIEAEKLAEQGLLYIPITSKT